MENFDTNQSLFSQFSTFDPETLAIVEEFGDTDEQLESMESDLGIDQGWLADMEEGKGGRLSIEGHQEVLEQTLRDHIEDVDNAACSRASRRSNFSQSTGNSTNNLTAAGQLTFNHKDQALHNVALLNANSDLQNELANKCSNLAVAGNSALYPTRCGLVAPLFRGLARYLRCCGYVAPLRLLSPKDG
jgi:hypothetical protein